MMFFKFVKGFFMLAAVPTWTASFVPMTIGFFLAFSQKTEITFGDYSWIVLSFIAMAFIETGKHAVNDYYDFKSGNDLAVNKDNVTSFSGGKKVLTKKILTNKQVILIGVGSFFIASAIGLVIVVYKSPIIMPIGIMGIISSVIYTMPPFKLCYRGFGELAVAITYGPLILFGAYFVFESTYFIVPLLLSIHVGFLIANVLLINEFPDWEADLVAGKYNFLARVGKKRGAQCHLALFLISFMPIFILALYTQNGMWLWTLALTPLMLASYINSKKNLNNIKALLISNKLTIFIHLCSGVILAACCCYL